MKPFDLEAAKRGEPLVTCDGRTAKFVAHVPEADELYRVVTLLDGEINCYSEEGRMHEEREGESSYDLFMASRKRTVWVNVYPFGDAEHRSTQEMADTTGHAHRRIGNRAWPLEIEE